MTPNQIARGRCKARNQRSYIRPDRKADYKVLVALAKKQGVLAGCDGQTLTIWINGTIHV